MSIDKETQVKLMHLLQEAITHDEELRIKYQIDDKFRFIRERLKALLEQTQQELEITIAKTEENKFLLSADEVLVHVHLFNAKGLTLSTWKNMVLPKVFYEYSINRPIYAEKKGIDAFIKNKDNKMQHGYVTLAVKKDQILSASITDSLGNELIKVKEGSLRFERFSTFTHNEQEYKLNEEGDFFKG